MHKSLQQSEWILVGSLLLIMASLLLVARVSAHRSSSLLASHRIPEKTEHVVTISGAVSKPGAYKAQSGTLLKKVLRKSRPSRFADLKRFDDGQRVESDLAIEVGLIQEIQVSVVKEGEDPMELTLPAGTRASDLKSKVPFSEVYDLSVFKSRRMLKDGEILTLRKK
jgi:hypothetical protein